MKNIFFVLLLIPLLANCQKGKTRFFINENFGLDVDTNQFKLFNEYSNSVYLIKGYDFKYYLNDTDYIYIVTTEEYLPNECNDSMIQQYASQLTEKINASSANDTVNLSVSEVKSHDNYFYYIITGSLKQEENTNGNVLSAFRCYNNVVMKVMCASPKNKVLNEDELFNVFKKFTQGITYYADEEVKIADSIATTGLKPIIQLSDKENYTGKAWLSGAKVPQIVELGLNIGGGAHRIFTPGEDNTVEFSFKPRHAYENKSTPTGDGYFIVKNSLGKEIKIEFDFNDEFKK